MKKIAILAVGCLALVSLAACNTPSYNPPVKVGADGDRHPTPKSANDGVEGTDQNGKPQ